MERGAANLGAPWSVIISQARRLGRPPDSSSDDTRTRILTGARRCFAQHGYSATTNRELAAEAGLTTGAIYHYFNSKTALFDAVYSEVQGMVRERFEQRAADAGPSFIEKLSATLDEARQLNVEDHSLAGFLVAAQTDILRHDELAELRHRPRLRGSFFVDLVDLGISTGEIDAADRTHVLEVITAVTVGLTSASSHDVTTHALAVEGIKRLLAGTLLRPPNPDRL